MKLFLSLLVGVGIIGVGYWYLTSQIAEPENAVYTSEVFTYTTDDNQFSVQYNEDGDKAQLSLNGTQYELESVVSGSGAKYASADGTMIFWGHQEEALVEKNGETLFANATLAGSEAERRRVEVLKSNKQGDPSANKYDFGSEGMDDDDGDSVPVEESAAENDGGSITIEPGATLVAQAWQLKGIVQTDGTAVVPADPTLFVATFTSEGTFNSSTDCNSVFGSYEITETALTFGPLASTKKACAGDIFESTYVAAFSGVDSYQLSQEGDVTLKLTGSTGTLTFVATSDSAATNN